MNEIETALLVAEHAQYHTFIADGRFYYADGVKELVITALREKLEREKGCECCNQHNAMELGAKVYNQRVSYYIVGDGYPHSEKHRFCPLCGRKLKTVMPGEEV